MCGIVGYVGKRQASTLLVEGLSKLEYRGYDSAGVAILNNGINVRKFKGRLNNLATSLIENPIEGHIGIGHTRWATHGEPSDVNSHPHTTENATISVVHNGIIENYMKLREWLTSKGYTFFSETDTEVIPNLVDYYYEGDLFEAVVKATSKLEGSFAIGVIAKNEPDKIIAVRKDSPLIVGLGTDESFIASDIPAVLNHTREVYLLEDKEFAILTEKGIELKNEEGEKIEKEIYHVTWNIDAAEKGGFEDFMLKEIHEQPKAVKDTLAGKIALGKEITLDNITFTKEQLENFDKIYVVACGTAYHAGVVGKTVIEKFAKIPVEIDIASEFRYRDPMITNKTLLIVVSQSGETADTLAVLRDAKKQGARVLAITNVVGSSIARESDDIFYTWAGPEIAVASTKAYTTQLTAFYMIALNLAMTKGSISDEEYFASIEELRKIYEKCGCKVIFISAYDNTGIDILMDTLKDKTTILAGPSGVGKSSLTNIILPDRKEEGEISKTGDVSRIGRGRHTTRHSEIFNVTGSTYICDTPGFTSLNLPELEKEQVRFYFNEFDEYEGTCRFNGCVHINEPDCAVKMAVEKGVISRRRYTSYVELYEEIKNQKKY